MCRWAAFTALLCFAPADAQTEQPESSAKVPEIVEAWAMLFQMTERLSLAVERREFSLVHNEDPIASVGVTVLLSDNRKRPAPDPAQDVALAEFARQISALHTAADASRDADCVELMKNIAAEFQALQKSAGPGVLEAARKFADRYTCPMHPDEIGRKGDVCAKCGMSLDQRVVLLPFRTAAASLVPQRTVRAAISPNAPVEVDKEVKAVLHLSRLTREAVTPAELIETHTQKIHLLLIDGSLTDYHHVHPEVGGSPGDYLFSFTPRKPGPYTAWADIRPTPLGLQEYAMTTIPSPGASEPLRDKAVNVAADAAGLHYELIVAAPEIKVAEPATARLRVTKQDGSGFTELEPVMATFAHFVGFNEDGRTVMHMHPSGVGPRRDTDRGGPELEFKIYATKAGFTRLFAQVQIGGRQIFVPFGINVVP